jgi:hypothetical protein
MVLPLNSPSKLEVLWSDSQFLFCSLDAVQIYKNKSLYFALSLFTLFILAIYYLAVYIHNRDLGMNKKSLRRLSQQAHIKMHKAKPTWCARLVTLFHLGCALSAKFIIAKSRHFSHCSGEKTFGNSNYKYRAESDRNSCLLLIYCGSSFEARSFNPTQSSNGCVLIVLQRYTIDWIMMWPL